MWRLPMSTVAWNDLSVGIRKKSEWCVPRVWSEATERDGSLDWKHAGGIWPAALALIIVTQPLGHPLLSVGGRICLNLLSPLLSLALCLPLVHQLSLHLDWMKSVTTSLVSWPAVSLISHLAWHTRTAVQQRAHYASPLTLPRASSFKYKVSKAGWFCNTYLIFASLRVQSFARLTVYEGVITPTVAAEVIWNANSPDNPLPPLWTTLTAYC